jgi:hypothetical protein
MSEVKRYRTSGVRLQEGKPHVVLTESPSGRVCLYANVEPIVKRNKELESENKELEAEIKRLREQEPAQELPSCMVDDDIGVNLCDVCGNPVRYGSRHHMCEQDSKKEK